MSYAEVAAANAPSPADQPRPDPGLLNTAEPSSATVLDDTKKVNLVHPSLKDAPVTETSISRLAPDSQAFSDDDEGNLKPNKSKTNRSRRIQEVEAEGAYLWQLTKQYLFRPGVAGGLIGLVNIGLLTFAGHTFYTQPRLRSDRRFLSYSVATALALLSVEGYAAERYRQTPRGREEERRAKAEGTLIYKHLREVLLRPGVLGGLIGAVNVAVLGVTGYYSYLNWNRPSWDRRTVSTVSSGLLALFGGEAVLASILTQ